MTYLTAMAYGFLVAAAIVKPPGPLPVLFPVSNNKIGFSCPSTTSPRITSTFRFVEPAPDRRRLRNLDSETGKLGLSYPRILDSKSMPLE